METLVSNNCVDIKDIREYESMILENNVKNVYFGHRTARNISGECFLFENNSIFYVFTYHSKYGIYKNISDYKDGMDKNFENSLDYYISLKNNNITNTNFDEYLNKEYNFNRRNAEEMSHTYASSAIDYQKCLLEMMEIIFKIENIKNKYNLNRDDSILIYLLNNYNDEYIIMEDFMKKCAYGINLEYPILHDDSDDRLYRDARGDRNIFLSKEFINLWESCIDGDWTTEKKYVYDKKNFMDILSKIKDITKLIEIDEEKIYIMKKLEYEKV